MKNKFIQKKLLIVCVTFMLTAGMATGCGTSTEVINSTTSTESTSSETESSDTVTVQVTNIEGSTITAVVGELESNTDEVGGSAPDGVAPDQNLTETTLTETTSTEEATGSSDSSNGSVENETEDMDLSTEIQDAPSGEAPSTGGSTFVEGDETITFTVSDDTVITVEYQQGSSEGTIDDISENSVLEVELDDANVATTIVIKNLQSGSGFGGSDEVTNGTSANTIDEDTEVSDETYESTGDDENALRVDGATVSLSGITINKTGGETSNTENGDFYGMNAGLLALNGATVTISDATVNTSAQNGNGVFSYGEGTTVNISDSTIHTTADNSGGIQTTGGGTTNATDLTVETEGNSSAAIRSDRGGGTVNVDGGSYTTGGTGSPAIYSTADISVSNATLTANSSEGVVVEGENSVSLTDCDLTGNMMSTDDSENLQCIMIYQSMSGDAETGNASFSMTGGSLTSLSGDLFYVTNTTCTIDLSDVALTLANDTLFNIAGNSNSRGWGTEGANGGDVTVTADNQKLEGLIIVDDISSLDLTMSNGTTYEGAINSDGEAGTVNVTIDDDSTWTLTADSYISSLDGDVSQIVANGFTLYVNGEAVSE